MKKHRRFVIVVGILIFMSISSGSLAQTAPYPYSNYITEITYNWSTHIRLAPGSDNWPITWADDDHQYSSWGDGGGFGGNDALGRVSLGVARIEGPKSAYTGYNVWGGYNAENPADVDGKSRGIICVNGILYMWVGPGSYPNGFNESRLYTSTDHAATWVKNNSWAFIKSEGIIMPGFLQFGKNFADARDNYAYIYAQRYVSDTSQIPGKIDLMRVDKTQILTRASYEFFDGFDLSGDPIWTSDLTQREAVFEDPNGVGRGLGVGVMYNPGLDRYILTVEHGIFAKGNYGVFEAPEPWGPWKTVEYVDGFGAGHVQQTTFYWNISPKWLSSDGEDFVMIFTGIDSSDSWNTVEAAFTTIPIPIELSDFSINVRGSSVSLSWKTITEVNSYGFDLQKRFEIDQNTGKQSDWELVTFIPAAGNSNSIKDYSFIDENIANGKYEYRLKMIDADGSYSYSNIVQAIMDIPLSFELYQNFPNPFNPSTKISWQSPISSWQVLKVFDVLGNEVAVLVDEYKPAGKYEVEVDFSPFKGNASGLYFYKLKAGEFEQAKKLVLLK